MKCLFATFLAAVTLGAAPAAAVVLTFDGVENSIYSSPIVRNGFSIGNVAGDEQHFHELNSDSFPAEEIPNGTGILFNDRNTSLEFTQVGGGVFTLGSFNASALRAGSAAGGATTLSLTAFVNGVQTSTLLFEINSDTYGSFSGAGLGAFDRLTFDGLGGGGGFALDNVTLNGAVPEPATWALMIGGFAAVGGTMRSRRRAALTA